MMGALVVKKKRLPALFATHHFAVIFAKAYGSNEALF